MNLELISPLLQQALTLAVEGFLVGAVVWFYQTRPGTIVKQVQDAIGRGEVTEEQAKQLADVMTAKGFDIAKTKLAKNTD